MPTIDLVEQRSLHFFYRVTQHDVSRSFEPHFWGRLAWQASRAYLTVQYALEAVSAMYEAYLRMEHVTHQSQGVLDTPTSRSALVAYSKAVKLISKDMSAGTIPLEAVLICCLLFVWLEFLRNDFATGMKHLRSGLSILLEAPGILTRRSLPLTAVDGSIPHIFTRLQIQATLHGCPSSDFNSAPMPCPSEAILSPRPHGFLTLAEARYFLDSKLLYIFQFIREKEAFEASRGIGATGYPEWSYLVARRDTHVAELMRWRVAFRSSSLFRTSNTVNSVGVLLLRLNFKVALMALTGLFFYSEMQYDEYNAEFQQLLTLVERILQSGPSKGNCLVLSLDTGIIPSLFFIILKCRERTIRRKAMEALKSAPEREGMWHRDSIIAATSWKVSVEEDLAARVFGVYQGPPPRDARIYRERVRDANSDGKSALVRFDGGPTGSSVTEWELNGLLSRLGDMM
ncbi:unnamed protein product [Clonostachys rosea f. rosea IK726]|uniref:Uncharacterized protein n=1 Tax=Clonostachys rosea f. rosea IK726 TaxID=1349383 RepID=A0ACA9U808_BIOOC|nr:unnamed protein product [Clonostachys rosea f. rosea IK726]